MGIREHFTETRSTWYEMFNTRHNRKAEIWDRLIELGVGGYLLTANFAIELISWPIQSVWRWFKRWREGQ